MFKQSVRTISIIAALFSIHTAASATCVGTDCQVDITGSFDFDLGSNTDGIFVQKNVGTNTAIVDLKNVVMRENGDITGTATAIGNNFSLSLDNTSVSDLSVAQCNVSDNVALATFQWDPTKLTASATAIGNNISIGGARP